MDINWTTFLFEIANFLILVWIVWRFLYRPVREILDRRRMAVAAEIANANTIRADADRIRDRYESRLTEWQTEKAEAMRELDAELSRQREARLEVLRKEIDERADAARLLEERRLTDLRVEAEKRAAAHGARLATRILSLAATPDLQRRLLEMVLTDIAAAPVRQEGRGAAMGDGPLTANVASAFDIEINGRQALEKALTARFGEDLSFHYDLDPDLIAGVRVSVGALEWGANLRDELRCFAESADAGR